MSPFSYLTAPPAHPDELRARRGRCRSAQPEERPDAGSTSLSCSAVTRPDRKVTKASILFARRGLSRCEVPAGRKVCSGRGALMRYIGLDLHKHALEVCALDRHGKRLFRLSVDCRRPALEQ